MSDYIYIQSNNFIALLYCFLKSPPLFLFFVNIVSCVADELS